MLDDTEEILINDEYEKEINKRVDKLFKRFELEEDEIEEEFYSTIEDLEHSEKQDEEFDD